MKAAEILVLMRTRIKGEINTSCAALIFKLWEDYGRDTHAQLDPDHLSSLTLAKFARQIYESS